MPSFSAIENEISNMLDIPDEQLTDEQRAAWDAYMTELGKQEADKIDNFALFVRIESAHAEALRTEAQRLSSRARTAENRIAYLKKCYTDTLKAAGLQCVNGSVYRLSIRSTDVVRITDDAILPAEYVRTKTTTEPDKVALKSALKEGQAIPGAELEKSYSLIVG